MYLHDLELSFILYMFCDKYICIHIHIMVVRRMSLKEFAKKIYHNFMQSLQMFLYGLNLLQSLRNEF